MSRVLKFRAYDSATGKVSEPFDVKESWGDYLIDFDDYSTDGALDSIIWEQFTGLLDRNGKEIYEGDIVKFADLELAMKPTGVVCFADGRFFVKDWEFNDGSYHIVDFYDYNIPHKDFEVIGNIHENPEHLKRMGVSICKGGEDE